LDVVTILPFRGLRPLPELAARVAAPPYDVLGTEEARGMAEGNPHSFLRVNKAEIELGDVDPHSPEVYARAAENLARFQRDGVMIRDATPCFYLYRLTMNGRAQTGLVARTSVDEYEGGVIKKHEHTRPAKVADRADHIQALGAQVGPVFSTFRARDDIGALFDQLTTTSPAVAFDAPDGVGHALWVVDDPTSIEKLRSHFAALDVLYIADGHHRSEAASEFRRRVRAGEASAVGAGTFLNVLFADRELNILPYNRVVRELGGLSIDEILARAETSFSVAPADRAVAPERPRRFGVYAEGRWWVLDAREGSFDAQHPTRSIDAAILGDNFLAPILGITDPRSDTRIDFVGGIRGTRELERLVDSGEYALAFSLHATSIAELLRVADAGEVMPPKSTWFEPKLRSGMVVNLLDE
jgi:uncharacterized protein (DUF1015 family)